MPVDPISSAAATYKCFAIAGPIMEHSRRAYEKEVYQQSTRHFVFAKAVLPLLKDSKESSYTIISNIAGGLGYVALRCKGQSHGFTQWAWVNMFTLWVSLGFLGY